MRGPSSVPSWMSADGHLRAADVDAEQLRGHRRAAVSSLAAAAGSSRIGECAGRGRHEARRCRRIGLAAERAGDRVRLVLAGDQEDDLLRGVDCGKRHRDARHPRIHPRLGHIHHQAFLLVDRGHAGEERGGVRVGSQPEQDEIEGRRLAERLDESLLVEVRGTPRVLLAGHALHARPARQAVQQRRGDHPVVGVGMVGRDTTLVAEPERRPAPVAADLGGLLVRAARGAASGQGDVRARAGGIGEQCGGAPGGIVRDDDLAPHGSMARAASSAGPYVWSRNSA